MSDPDPAAVARGPRASAREWLPLAVGSVLFGVHALVLGAWLVDDAGITYAYSRSLAQGYGLVSQPGAPPVEGYSNFLWVLCFVPFFRLGLFHPVLTAKILSVGMVVLAFAVVDRAMCRYLRLGLVARTVLLGLAAMNTCFVVWCVSGLENPLYVLLACLLLLGSLQALAEPDAGLGRPALWGVLAACTAMTRPDGALYFAAYPLALLVRRLWAPRSSRRAARRPLMAYGVGLLAVFGGFVAFRLLYFGDLVPNTYHAKGGPTLADVVELALLHPEKMGKLLFLMTGIAGPLGSLLFAGVGVGTVFLVSTRRFGPEPLVLLLFAALSAAVHVLLPRDWMGHYRFATPFFLFFTAYLAVVGEAVIGALAASPASRKRLAAGTILVAGAACLVLAGVRSGRFVKDPTVPFDEVSERLGHRFNWCAEQLGLRNASLLTHDLGGTLYYSKLRVYDLGMLCDRTIARTLGKKPAAFYDYIFDAVKPTFISTASHWTYLSRFHEDGRFLRDYVPLYEYPDTYSKERFGAALSSGDYVRKDAIVGKDAELRRLVDRFEKDGPPRYVRTWLR